MTLPYPVIATTEPCAVCQGKIQPGQLYIIEMRTGEREVVTHVWCKWPKDRGARKISGTPIRNA